MYLQLISVVVVIRLADVRMYVRAMVRIWGLSLHVCTVDAEKIHQLQMQQDLQLLCI
jgi:hypothetical protein